MLVKEIPFLTNEHKLRICELWNNEYPQKLVTTTEGFDDYLSKTTHHRHFLLSDQHELIQGWAYTFDRDAERWFSIIIDKSLHGKGYGRLMIDVLQENENELCGWVTDNDEELLASGDRYKSPLNFYLKLGFVTEPDVRFETEKMSAVKIRWKKPRRGFI